MTLINLLPWREQARYESKIRFLVILAIFVSLALCCALLYHLYFSSLIAEQERNNAIWQAELDKEEIFLKTTMDKKKNQSILNDNIAFIFSLRESGYQAVRLLNELTRTIPDAVLIKEIKREKNKITLNGKAESNLQITILMENVAKSPIFIKPVLTEISGKGNDAVNERNFQLKFQQQ